MAERGEEKHAFAVDGDLSGLPQWDNYADPAESEESEALGPVNGDTERPPLTGKRRYVPEGLYDQPWSSVHDAYGTAALTPYYIEALTSEDPADVRFGIYGLYSATTHQGSVYKSSQMAVPFLVHLLQLDNEAAEQACHFLARIALGEQHFIGAPSQFAKTKYYGTVRKYRKAIQGYLERTGSEEALRLLCLMPGTLPDRLDLSYEGALSLAKGDARLAFLRQASTLIAQGFIASERNYAHDGYPPAAGVLAGTDLPVTGHIEEARELLVQSPSLLVRGCAAICLAFTGIVDRDILGLLEIVGEQELSGVPWAWDEFSSMARYAWMFAADPDTLIDSDKFLRLDHTTYEADGTAVPHYLPTERLASVAQRIFPAAYTREGRELPLLPEQLDRIQQKALRRILEAVPKMLGSYHVSHLNLPSNVYSARRTLGDSDELLCSACEAGPLWFVLERAVLEDRMQEALTALEKLDAWQVLKEIYRPMRTDRIEESVTLNLQHAYDDKKTSIWEARLASLMADALGGCQTPMFAFLDEWLEKAPQLEGFDWRFQTAGQRIGICLLSLARAGSVPSKYEPLVRPYHSSARYSSFPVPLLQEVLEQTSGEHRAAIRREFQI